MTKLYIKTSSDSGVKYVPYINDEPIFDGYGADGIKTKEFDNSYAAIKFIRNEIDSIIEAQGASSLNFRDCDVMKVSADGWVTSVWCALDEPKYAKLHRENIKGNARYRY